MPSPRTKPSRFILAGALAGPVLLVVAGMAAGILGRSEDMTVLEAVQMVGRSLRPSLDSMTAFAVAALVGTGIGAVTAFVVGRKRRSPE